MNDTPIHVMLLDDHDMIRDCLALAIDMQGDMVVCAQSSSADEGVRALSTFTVDIVLVDISLQGGADGFDFIRMVKERYASVKTLVVSMHNEPYYAQKAIQCGAMGYLTKNKPVDKIFSGIREVMNDNTYISEEISGKLIRRLVLKENCLSGNEALSMLTPREREIFSLIGLGYTPKEIARELSVSVNTIEAHRRNIREKLGVSSSNELMKMAIKLSMQK